MYFFWSFHTILTDFNRILLIKKNVFDVLFSMNHYISISKISCKSIAANNAVCYRPLIGFYTMSQATTATHHADFEGVEQVKGQCGHQVNNEPCGQVMKADLSSIEDHLARLADVRGAKIKNDICPGWIGKQQQTYFGYY